MVHLQRLALSVLGGGSHSSNRWVRSAREMCVDRMIFFGEKSLRHAMSEVERFYDHELPHQRPENKIIKPDFGEPMLNGDIECRSRLGGLMKYYFRKAAPKNGRFD
jgi:putative transposase